MTQQRPTGKHCTYALDGYSVECYDFRVRAEYRTKKGELVARLCSRHDTPGARRAADDMGLVRHEP